MAIEQGRCTGISIPALHRLADALELSVKDRRALFQLAGHPLVEESESEDRALVTDATAQVSNSIRGLGSPAFALDELWNAVSWNDQAEALFPGWLGDGRDHNLLRFAFLNLAARRSFHPWAEWAAGLAGDFKASSRHLSMSQAELVDSLCQSSDEFSTLYQSETNPLPGYSSWRVKVQDEYRTFVRSQINIEGVDLTVTVLTGFAAQSPLDGGSSEALAREAI